MANENIEYYREEVIVDENQPLLFSQSELWDIRPGFEVGTKRKNLPVDHPEYQEDGHYSVVNERYLENFLGVAWFNTFEELLQDYKKKTGMRIKLVRKGTGSPKYYNYGTDWASFDLQISKANLKRIVRIVFKHKEIFEEYCKKYHSSYDGVPLSFRSSMPYNSLEQWQEYFETGEGHDHWEKAVWMLLEFALFAYNYYGNDPPSLAILKANLNEWEKDYESEKEDLWGNGVVDECMDFITGEQHKEWLGYNCVA